MDGALPGSVTTVLVSGMHSGPNPSPGLGVARSLKRAWPGVTIVGIDYAATSSGLHSPLVDRVVQLPAWSQVHLETWREQIRALLADDETVFIPCLDLEVRLLAAEFADDDRVLAPSGDALAVVQKPAVDVALALAMRVPPHETDVSPEPVERFLRLNERGAWVKGQHYEAFRVRTPDEANAAGEFVADVWGGDWHLEGDVAGQECGVAFCARAGRLIDAVFMSKTLLTADGKTWSGEIAELPSFLAERLRRFVSDRCWHGAGEIELIRSWDGSFTVMEVNPRFPAWVHGATVCGCNLPAALVVGGAMRTSESLLPGFTRLVEEIPVAGDLGIVSFPWGWSAGTGNATKHPSGMRFLGQRDLLHRAINEEVRELATAVTGPSSRRKDVFQQVPPPRSSTRTPYRELLVGNFVDRVAELRAALRGIDPLVLAQSVKTCPHPALLRAAAECDLVVEAITLDELAVAVECGLSPSRAILNGPAKWWPAREEVRCWAFFADSVEELEDLWRRLHDGFLLRADIVGVRVAPPTLPTRFGIQLDEGDVFARVGELLVDITRHLDARWGVQFHHAESTIGPDRWRREAIGALRRASALGRRVGIPPAVVNLGGGWHFDDLQVLAETIPEVLDAVRCDDAVRPITVLEPGKVLSQGAAAIVTQALVRRHHDKEADVVVDACLGDLPEAPHRCHPIARFDGERWEPLRGGSGRVLGRSCMEHDVLAEGVDLRDVAPGDYLAFGMCGAYDMSMAYDFGRGRMTDGLDGSW